MIKQILEILDEILKTVRKQVIIRIKWTQVKDNTYQGVRRMVLSSTQIMRMQVYWTTIWIIYKLNN